MLILSRHKQEVVMVVVPPSDKEIVISVTVSETRSDKVKIGFVGPDEVGFWREEVYRRKLAEASAA